MIDVNQITRILFGLVMVLGFMFAVAYFVKKLKNNNYLGGKGITVLSNLLLGNKERIVLLEVEGQKALIGITSHAIETLMIISKPASKCQNIVKPNSTSQFKTILEKQQEVG